MAIVEIINLTKSFKDIEVIHNTCCKLRSRDGYS
ncbi:lantibiotic transport ATP-binding protein [Streptococcus pneumoniae]|nr:lantibiotic transport ATP-binding protein [Streptococcus pneumoniae]